MEHRKIITDLNGRRALFMMKCFYSPTSPSSYLSKRLWLALILCTSSMRALLAKNSSPDSYSKKGRGRGEEEDRRMKACVENLVVYQLLVPPSSPPSMLPLMMNCSSACKGNTDHTHNHTHACIQSSHTLPFPCASFTSLSTHPPHAFPSPCTSLSPLRS